MNNVGVEQFDVVKNYLDIKKKYQNLYFEHQEVLRKCKNLEEENRDLKEKLNSKCILKENQRLVAKVCDMRRSTTMNITPKKTTFESEKEKENDSDSQVYEVEYLIDHRGRKPKREFLVRWRGFSERYDTWESEINLSCPKILKEYLKRHRLT